MRFLMTTTVKENQREFKDGIICRHYSFKTQHSVAPLRTATKPQNPMMETVQGNPPKGMVGF